jgi:ribosomal protein S18 acetylase RimI-like enzyme
MVIYAKNIEIRLARKEEADMLSELAIRSKSYWNYDQDYLNLCRSVLTVTKEEIKQWPFIVAVANNHICGFAAICETKGEQRLNHLWVDPATFKRGIGKILFMECIRQAKLLDWSQIIIESDPYAEDFYRKMGAEKIGERESLIKKGIFLPLFRYNILNNF